MKLAQIVITRIDDNTLRIITFDSKECVGSEPVSEKEADKIIAEAVKQLNVTRQP